MLLSALLALQSVVNLPPLDPCLDDNHRHVCAAGVKAKVLAKQGLVSIEVEAETGAEIYRSGSSMAMAATRRLQGSDGALWRDYRDDVVG